MCIRDRPKDIEAVKQLKSRLSETNTLIALEKERVSKGISDMERIKDNFCLLYTSPAFFTQGFLLFHFFL